LAGQFKGKEKGPTIVLEAFWPTILGSGIVSLAHRAY
jgi:hypothetical protein